MGFSLLTLFSLPLSLSPSLGKRQRHSEFSYPFSINLYQHSRFRHLEISLPCSLPLSLSVSVSTNTHHICADSQLARSAWSLFLAETAVSPKNTFNWLFFFVLFCFFSSVFVSVWVECEVLCPSSQPRLGWQQQTQWQAAAVAGPGWACLHMWADHSLGTVLSDVWDVCLWDKDGLKVEARKMEIIHVLPNVCECVRICLHVREKEFVSSQSNVDLDFWIAALMCRYNKPTSDFPLISSSLANPCLCQSIDRRSGNHWNRVPGKCSDCIKLCIWKWWTLRKQANADVWAVTAMNVQFTAFITSGSTRELSCIYVEFVNYWSGSSQTGLITGQL